jgi:hypothetical protein
VGLTRGLGEAPGDAEGDADGLGEGLGGGGLGTVPIQLRETDSPFSSATRSWGAGGGDWTTSVATEDKAETRPRSKARAATRTVVPGDGRGEVSVRLSPGAARRFDLLAVFWKSPAASARNISMSRRPRLAPPVVARGVV